TEAVYVIGTEDYPAGAPPTLIFLEPVDTVEVVPGGDLNVAIIDDDPDSSAALSFYLEPFEAPATEDDTASTVATNGTADTDGLPDVPEAEPTFFSFALDGDEIVLGTDFAEDLDGQDDRFTFALPQDLPLGTYRLIGVITDELSAGIVQAPGLVQVVAADSAGGNGQSTEEPEDENVAPTLDLVEPADDHTVAGGASLTVAWTDEDPDDNALISLFLDPDDDPLNGNETALAENIAEDPDDDGGDFTNLVVPAVPPGIYRVLGVIDDGTVSVIATAPGRITVFTP
ncbi:MAG TPA: hypothetical protein VM243_03880, partial [Phycisphaerae bacterium]|nr:hypothetical protein [Phycisphaerae bacterium]